MEKLCVYCPHFSYEGINYRYYSTRTGGDIRGGFSCLRNHYFDERPDDTSAFRELILRAENCSDFEFPKCPIRDKT